MLNNTRRKLTLFNTLVVSVFLAFFGMGIYFFSNFKIMNEINRSLNEKKVLVLENLTTEDGMGMHGMGMGMGAQKDAYPQVGWVMWDAVGQVYYNRMTVKDPNLHEGFFKAPQEIPLNQLSTVEVEGMSYKVLLTQTQQEGTPYTVQLFRNISGETDTLNQMAKIILLFWLLGSACSYFIGRILARKALVPIESAWNQQQKFVADASHELRTPIASIQNFAELLLHHPDHTISEEAEAVSLIRKESKRLGRLTNDLLTLARSDSNQIHLNKRSFELSNLLIELSAPFKIRAELKELTFERNIPSGISFNGDSDRIAQLLIILLDNAFKFTPAKGRIQLALETRKNEIEIIVTDTGIGIPHMEQEKIFHRFYQVDASRVNSDMDGGSGLGLSIAWWIVESHGGKILVESKIEEGTTFKVILPILN